MASFRREIGAIPMKNLVFLLILASGLAACGGDKVVMFDENFDKWYAEFYADCTELCDECTKLDVPNWYTKELCTEAAWNYGLDNTQCHRNLDTLDEGDCLIDVIEDRWW
jgi:hypothetical protein